MIKGNKSHLEDIQILVFDTTIWQLKNATFWREPPYELDIWLQSYEQFISTKNNIKQKNLTELSLPISQKQYLQHPTHSSW